VQVFDVSSYRERRISACPLKGFENVVSLSQAASHWQHASGRTWSTVQSDQQPALSSVFANK